MSFLLFHFLHYFESNAGRGFTRVLISPDCTSHKCGRVETTFAVAIQKNSNTVGPVPWEISESVGLEGLAPPVWRALLGIRKVLGNSLYLDLWLQGQGLCYLWEVICWQ